MTVALTTGLRRSELLGLEWKHVDFNASVIDVRQTTIHALKGEVIVKQPKTKKSVRKIALPRVVFLILPPRWTTVLSRATILMV
ncbi:tyrosine-type recombinase/integrase [Paenibacillus sp.]|uniref:tyrosine-type recombinase/integrase n=1 Tax=Paenibacillus sp. TaxID=58172 RepID=UPI0035C7EB26